MSDDVNEQEAERLRSTVPGPDGPGCHVIEVDGEPVRVQGDGDMPPEVRDALEDVIRAVQRNHPGGRA